MLSELSISCIISFPAAELRRAFTTRDNRFALFFPPALVHVEANQCSHSKLPRELANVPGAHGMQDIDPVLLVNVPAGHGSGDLSVPAHVKPRGHVDCCSLTENNPLGTATCVVGPDR